ncbi:MAG: aromatic-ring-hydroxylating dioxygenase subunit beta [Pseudomonadota bacterium]
MRPAATQRLIDRYDGMRALLDSAMTAGPSVHTVAAEAAPILEAEARLLDAGAYAAWLALYAEDAYLWIPAHPDDHPGRDQALAFDDRRRLSERARHMGDPQAWAITAPAPITVRQLGPIAAWATPGGGIVATATLTVTHVRRGPAQVLHGRQVFSLEHQGGSLLISAKILVFPELALGALNIGWVI